MNFVLIALYVAFAVAGSTLIKYGGIVKMATLFTVPLVGMKFSIVTLIGFISYGLSFLLYTVLLNKFDLSFISPITVGVVYILLMITSVFVFNESFNLMKIIGCILILVGVLLMAMSK